MAPRVKFGPTSRPRARRGAVLVEALLGALLGALVLAAALDAMVRVTRHGRELDARAAARARLEQAVGALSSDLRPITTATSGDDPADLRALADTVVELAASVGGGIACAVTAPAATGAGSAIDLASVPEAPGAPALVWWNAPPRAGDLAYFHDDAGTSTSADDSWTVRTVQTVSEGTTYCRSGPFAGTAATGTRADAPRLRLTLNAPALPATIAAGAPLRVARRRRYSLYRATEGWQLGVRDWDGGQWEVIQPLAGPFDTPSDRGLRLDAFDASGAPVQGSPPERPAVELRILLRAPCAARDPRLRCVDSAVAVVRPRGNA